MARSSVAPAACIRADNPDEFITAFHRITRILEQPDVVILGDAAKHILVEGYVAGREVVPLPEGNRYLGFIFARGDSPDAVEEALRDSHHCLRFQIDPGAEAE